MGSRSGPIYTNDNRLENPRIQTHNSRPSSGGSSATGHDDGSAEMEAYALEKQEEIDALRRISGEEDLSLVTSLTMTVDSAEVNISHLGEHMPKLSELKMNHSVIESVRDLGTGLRHLKVLWLSRCGLQRLNGVSSLPCLRELYAAFNDISSLDALQGCDELEVVDLEGNTVAALAEVDILGLCWRLESASLEGNPVAGLPGYRARVAWAVPQLKTLDDLAVTEEERSAGETASVACPPGTTGAVEGDGVSVEAALVSAAVKGARVGFDSHEYDEVEAAVAEGWEVRPGTAGLRKSLAHLRPSTTGQMRKGSAGGRPSRPSSAFRPSSQQRPRTGLSLPPRHPINGGVSRSLASAGGLFWRKHHVGSPGLWELASASSKEEEWEGEEGSGGSELTQGGAESLGGGAAAALRRRRGKAATPASLSVRSAPSLRVSVGEPEMSVAQILAELREWKVSTTELVLRDEDLAAVPRPALDSDDEAAFAGEAEGVELMQLGSSDSDGEGADRQLVVNPVAAPPSSSPPTPPAQRTPKHRAAIADAAGLSNPLFHGDEGDDEEDTMGRGAPSPVLTSSMELLGQSARLRRSLSVSSSDAGHEPSEEGGPRGGGDRVMMSRSNSGGGGSSEGGVSSGVVSARKPPTRPVPPDVVAAAARSTPATRRQPSSLSRGSSRPSSVSSEGSQRSGGASPRPTTPIMGSLREKHAGHHNHQHFLTAKEAVHS